MRITQRATRRRILSRVKPTTASGLSMLAGPSIGDMLLAKIEDIEGLLARSAEMRAARFDELEELFRRGTLAHESLNSEVRRTMTAGPFSPDALSKMFQRMDNQMTVLKQTLDTLCARGHIHHGG